MAPFRNLGVWFKRFRYRCGYGVHSPFAFNFITGVIFERGEYYAYHTLDSVFQKGVFWRHSHLCTCWHFLFRLSNFVRPDFILTDAAVTQPERAYLVAACQRAVCIPANRLKEMSGTVLVYIEANPDGLSEILEQICKRTCPCSVLLLHTTSGKCRAQCTEIIRRSSHCGISFDLYDYLLVFFDRSLYKKHYIINFFD